MKKIYVYTTETYKSKNYYKVGETVNDVSARINQQDGTSCPEPLIMIMSVEVPEHITDKNIHKILQDQGYEPTRIDKKREWFDLSDPISSPRDIIHRAINQAVNGISRPDSYSLFSEQERCVTQITNFWKTSTDEFLVYAKMGFGKTFTTLKLTKEIKAKNVLILTRKPQVKEEWKNPIERHIDFGTYEFFDA
jgi:hypothetical protein